MIAARDRQILDLAKLDEEENRRVKQTRVVSRGVRAFRAAKGAVGSARGSAAPSGVSETTGGGSYGVQLGLLNRYMSGGG